MKTGKKTLVALIIAAGLYSHSNAVSFVSDLNDKEIKNLTTTLSNPIFEKPLYAAMTPYKEDSSEPAPRSSKKNA